jgi:glycosyltransferase involved in cell wall biosynthesis
MPDNIQISIIIPNLHSEIINQTIESVLSQSTSYDFEIIVVGMDKYGLVEQYPRVKFIRTPTPVGPAEARNIGIRHSRGKWLIFIDSDCVAQKGWIETFVSDFNSGWKVIGGGVESPTEPFLRLVYNLSMFHAYLTSKPRKETSYLPTLNLAVHREVINSVNLMDESLIHGEDIDWTIRMSSNGYTLLFDPSAMVKHLPKQLNLRALCKYHRKSGYYMIAVRFKYPGIFQMPQILRRPWTWKFLSPIISAGTSLKILFNSQEVRKHITSLPFIFLLKLAWCLGAAEGLETLNNGKK